MSKHRILIVDDDHDISRGVELRLRSAGYDTFTASDGAEGCAAAVDQGPDAIVMDVRMPKVDGIEALNTLSHDGRTNSTPVIVLSASLGDQQAALDAGARYFLKKPFRTSDLLTAIESVVPATK